MSSIVGTPLERKKEAKYLGVIFDEKMQRPSQISNITKKVNFKLGKIKSVASFLTSHTKKLLVNALVMPYFHYCSPAWSSAARKVDKKVVDASIFLGRKDNYSIYNVINKDMSLLIFKALNNIATNYICSKINIKFYPPLRNVSKSRRRRLFTRHNYGSDFFVTVKVWLITLTLTLNHTFTVTKKTKPIITSHG